MAEFRNIHDQELDNIEEAAHSLRRDGALVVLGQSTINIPTNSLNEVQAIKEGGDFGISTGQFTKRSNVLTKSVGKILFRLHDEYAIGITKVLLPIPIPSETSIYRVPSFTATHFAGKSDTDLKFQITFEDTGDLLIRGGDILICTSGRRRTRPYLVSPYSRSGFATETCYYSEKIQPIPQDLQEQYMRLGDELFQDAQGNVIWSKQRFFDTWR